MKLSLNGLVLSLAILTVAVYHMSSHITSDFAIFVQHSDVVVNTFHVVLHSSVRLNHSAKFYTLINIQKNEFDKRLQ